MEKTRRDLKWLKPKREYQYENPNPKALDTFPNPGVEEVALTCKEFTSLCPITGQPDYAHFKVTYAPINSCLESKSLKLYLGAYRQYRGFAEQITEKICSDLWKVLKPDKLIVGGHFSSRGGIEIETLSSRRL